MSSLLDMDVSGVFSELDFSASLIPITTIIVVSFIILWSRKGNSILLSGFPLAHRPGEDAVRSWILHGREIVSEALRTVSVIGTIKISRWHRKMPRKLMLIAHCMLVTPNQAEMLKHYQFPGPFQIMTPTGPKIILPNRFARDVGYSPVFNLPMAFGVVSLS